MVLWRLSGLPLARVFDGGYGLLFDGRWNSVGHAVTYCSTSPSLCVLEKLVHVQDPDLLPEMAMVRYAAPDDVTIEDVSLGDLPNDWRDQESWTQERGDEWHGSLRTPLFRAPSVVVPLANSPDMNILINHRHPAISAIRLDSVQPFALDHRLL
jgi:RES domain-containing protein